MFCNHNKAQCHNFLLQRRPTLSRTSIVHPELSWANKTNIVWWSCQTSEVHVCQTAGDSRPEIGPHLGCSGENSETNLINKRCCNWSRSLLEDKWLMGTWDLLWPLDIMSSLLSWSEQSRNEEKQPKTQNYRVTTTEREQRGWGIVREGMGEGLHSFGFDQENVCQSNYPNHLIDNHDFWCIWLMATSWALFLSLTNHVSDRQTSDPASRLC